MKTHDPRILGWLETISGCMYSGKSSDLVRRLEYAVRAKKRVIGFKHSIDDRYAITQIVTHVGTSHVASAVSSPQEIIDKAGDAEVVGVDEIQFFDEPIVNVVQLLVSEGRRVIVAGLDLDYLGRPFGQMPMLLSIADSVTKHHAACAICGGPATRTQRLVESSETVLVGAAGAYEARCRLHFTPLAEKP